jgi:hypothetical protein
MNVDTRYNLIHRASKPSPRLSVTDPRNITVNAVLHGAFDRNGWFLLPVDIEILEELRRFTRNPRPTFIIHEVRFSTNILAFRLMR